MPKILILYHFYSPDDVAPVLVLERARPKRAPLRQTLMRVGLTHSKHAVRLVVSPQKVSLSTQGADPANLVGSAYPKRAPRLEASAQGADPANLVGSAYPKRAPRLEASAQGNIPGQKKAG